eukprot:3910992-Rhodomonas_salina.3
MPQHPLLLQRIPKHPRAQDQPSHLAARFASQSPDRDNVPPSRDNVRSPHDNGRPHLRGPFRAQLTPKRRGIQHRPYPARRPGPPLLSTKTESVLYWGLATRPKEWSMSGSRRAIQGRDPRPSGCQFRTTVSCPSDTRSPGSRILAVSTGFRSALADASTP